MAHCESCGSNNPKTHDGYTVCCNELVCFGGHQEKFQHEETGENVRACCWSRAEVEWEKKYGHEVPNGAFRV